jgi:hypothetical protein
MEQTGTQPTRDIMKFTKQPSYFISLEFEQAVNEKKILLDKAQECEMNLKKLVAGRQVCGRRPSCA